VKKLKSILDSFLKMRPIAVAAFAGYLALACACMTAAQTNGSLSYRTKCAVCHGATGLGDTSAGKRLSVTSFQDPTVLAMPDATLENLIVSGSGKMPAYKGKLSDAEITSLIQYIRALQNGQTGN
jgi:mono/diheme cytochrome c family protein